MCIRPAPAQLLLALLRHQHTCSRLMGAVTLETAPRLSFDRRTTTWPVTRLAVERAVHGVLWRRVQVPDSEFVAARCAALQAWLGRLSAHPVIGHSQVRTFDADMSCTKLHRAKRHVLAHPTAHIFVKAAMQLC